MPDFSDRVVLITGATGGVGGAVTKSFLDAGATVAGVGGRSRPPEVEHPRLLSLSGDLTAPEGARIVVDQVLAKTKRIDALIHLVGGFTGGKTVADTDDATWRRMMDLNLHSALFTCRAVLPHMLAARRGRIVAVGSRTGVEPVATLGAYGVSKAALVALVRTIAAEVKESGITANILMPSVIDTPANRAANPAADFARWVKPEAIASLALWLASDTAADVNGAVIPVYGRA